MWGMQIILLSGQYRNNENHIRVLIHKPHSSHSCNTQSLMFAVQTQILSASLKKLWNTSPTFTQEEKNCICIISLISKKQNSFPRSCLYSITLYQIMIGMEQERSKCTVTPISLAALGCFQHCIHNEYSSLKFLQHIIIETQFLYSH